MAGNTQDDNLPGRENRAFSRNAIFLVGECVIPGHPDRMIEILDFCPGGIFLSFPIPPSPVPVRDQTIEIRCSVPAAGGVQSLHFQGRVARADQSGAGIAFINPSFEALHFLHEYAKSNPPAQTRSRRKKPAETKDSADLEAATELLLGTCRQMVEARLKPMVKVFLDQAGEHFFNLAGDARGIADKNAYYAALSTFNKDGEAFSSEFLTRMTNRLRQTPLLVSCKKDSDKSGELTLSLVEDDAFEDWLSFTDMARAAELEHKEELTALERRLSVLFRQPVDKENNPFGPGTISQIFQEALTSLELDRKIASESCKVFKKVLCQTGELYSELNQHLIDGGVLPVLRPGKQPAQPTYSARKNVADQQPEPAVAQPDPAAEPGITGLTAPPVHATDAGAAPDSPLPAAGHSSYAPPVAPGGAIPAGAVASPEMPGLGAAPGGPLPQAGQPSFVPPVAPGGAVPGSGLQATPPEGMPQLPQDWYKLMQGLGRLQQQLSAPAAHPGATPQMQRQTASSGVNASIPAPDQSGTPAELPAEPRHFTTDELLSALSRISQEAPAKPAGEKFHQDLMNKLQSALADVAPGIEAREMPSRETNILEIGSNLFDSVLTDRLVADTVKPWLNQLSIPLIKMSLRDDSLFYDKSHLARQLINQIAELELFSAASKVENAVRKKVDGLLSEISGADEVTPDLLQKMLKEVSLLVHVQNKAYEGNIRDLVAGCEAEDKLDKPAQKTSKLGKFLSGLQNLTGEEAPVEKDEALDEYRKRARRLKVGNWLMLGNDDLQKRIRLAWVGKNQEKFVFVNVQGLREETLNQDELAQYLRSGEAVVLDDGDEQLVDRAQSAMLQKMHHQLLHESSHDQLTGLINRREFEKRLTEILARVRDSGMPSMLGFIDLEQFSVVNNTFGYEGGDRALLEVSRLLGQELGKDGVLARIGGDEFAMLMENCSLDDALRVTSRLTGVFRAYRFTSEGKSLSLSFSAGLVTIDPESESVESLLQAAESSCRIARTKGTNYVQVYRPDEASLARQANTVKWVSRIDEALDKNSFELRCQPIVCVGGKKVAIHHSEVLLRVPDGKGKLISPVDLILAAEHFRRMSSVDRWVIEHAFRWMVDRRDRLDELGGLAINLSGASLNEEGLIDFVISKAEEHKIPMNKVCFEITETVGVSHLSSASEFISELKKKTGCSFSLDDFGSGQSSYAYLKNLPVDYLKIDGVFVDKMDQNPYDFAVVKSITEIGHFMGKKIIAERVESEAVLKMLREIGVDYAQGYYLGKPRNMKTLGS